MKQFTYVITDPMGLHARPAGLLAKEAKKYAAAITVTKDGRSADATRLMALMGLGIKNGDSITISVEGSDEESAAQQLEAYMKATL